MIKVTNERELHTEVVKYIRRFHTDAVMIPNVVELCDDRLESWKMGYTRGTPDLMIMNGYTGTNGLAIELKTPKGMGVASPEQVAFLKKLKDIGYETLLSSDFFEIIKKVDSHMGKCRLTCTHCKRHFKTDASLSSHLKDFHRIPDETQRELLGL